MYISFSLKNYKTQSHEKFLYFSISLFAIVKLNAQSDCVNAQLSCDCPPGNSIITIGSSGTETLYSATGLPSYLEQRACIEVYGALKIDMDLEVKNMPFLMQPGSSITIGEGINVSIPSDVIINSCSFVGCPDMWNGIVVNGHSSLNFIGNQIQDGIVAINCRIGSSLGLQDNCFERNYVGVQLNGGVSNLSVVDNNVFDCIGNLKSGAPNNAMISFCGIEYASSQGFIVGGNNYFYRMHNGIIANNSIINVRNGVFIDMPLPSSFPDPFFIKGFGIYAVNCPSVYLQDNIYENVIYWSGLDGCNNISFRESGIGNFYGISVNKAELVSQISTAEIMAIEARAISYFDCVGLDEFILTDNVITTNNSNLNWPAIRLLTGSVAGSVNHGLIKSNAIYTSGTHALYLDHVNNFSIKDNLDISFLGANSYGITLQTCNDIQVQDNIIDGPGITGTSTGVFHNASEFIRFCCNSVDNSYYGYRNNEFSGSSIIASFTFNNHQHGMYYEEDGVTGLQRQKGNIWNINSIAEDAYHEGVFLIYDLSRYIVDNLESPNEFFPDPPGTANDWFLFNSNGETHCSIWPPHCSFAEWFADTSVTELDLLILNDSLENIDFPQSLQWEGDKHLYEKIVSNFDTTTLDSVLLSFFLQNKNSNVGLLNTIRHLIYDRCIGDSSRIVFRAAYDEISGTNTELDSIYTLLIGATTVSDSILYLNQERDIVKDLDTLNATYNIAKSAYHNCIDTNLLTAKSILSNLDTSNVIVAKEVAFYELAISYYLFDSLSSYESVLLDSLANSCPDLYGNVVFYARSLNNLLDDSISTYQNNCPVSRPLFVENGLTISNEIEVWPNPITKNIETISCRINNYNQSKIFVSVMSITGRELFGDEIEVTNSQFKVPLHDNLQSGIYLIHCRDGLHNWISKLIVL